MLKHYTERGNDVERASTEIHFSSDLLSDEEQEEGNKNNIGDEGDIEAEPSSSTPNPTLTKSRKSRQPNPNISPERLCSKCKQYKSNGECSLMACKACCIASPVRCSIADHNRRKVGARQPSNMPSPCPSSPKRLEPTIPNIKERLETIVQAKREVYISYKKGTNGTHSRKIRPTGLSDGSQGVLLNAYCFVAKYNRSLFLHLITRMEDFDWEKPPPMAPPLSPASQGNSY